MPRTRKRKMLVEQVEQQPAGNVIDFEEILRAANIVPQANSEPAGVNIELGQSSSDRSLSTCPPMLGCGGGSLASGLDKTRCLSDEVFAHIPISLREKIWRGTFVNLALLLKGSGELDEFCTGGSFCLTNEGTIESRPREFKNKVPNIEKWTDAFIIYMSVYIVAHKEDAPDMLKYMFNIREAAQKQGGFAWRSYDEQFRLRQENSKMSWAVINTDLWWRCSLSSNSLGANNWGQSQTRPPPCLDYNKGNCRWKNCRFQHICSYCNGIHPLCNCFKRQNESLIGNANRGGIASNFQRFQQNKANFSTQTPRNNPAKK